MFFWEIIDISSSGRLNLTLLIAKRFHLICSVFLRVACSWHIHICVIYWTFVILSHGRTTTLLTVGLVIWTKRKRWIEVFSHSYMPYSAFIDNDRYFPHKETMPGPQFIHNQPHYSREMAFYWCLRQDLNPYLDIDKFWINHKSNLFAFVEGNAHGWLQRSGIDLYKINYTTSTDAETHCWIPISNRRICW